MTKLQQTEFNLLKTTVEICDKIGITYYLVCGSALGAVKYTGFIPWDDDVDIAMPRLDYKRFCKEAPELLPEYYFLQNIDTDKNVPFIFSKLRDSRTTYIEKSISHIDINHGVYIDIFPIDGYPTEQSEIQKMERSLKFLKLGLSSVYKFNSNMRLATKLLLTAERLLGFQYHTKYFIEKISKLISAYPTDTSHIWCNHGNWQGKLEYAPRSQYGEGTWAEFEGLKVRVPEKYDEYLTQKYGDWRDDLPKEQQVGHHYYEVCDLNRPYTDYIENLPNGRVKIKKPN
ncbi:MAG: phosphorylcholine transferase LicD [Ruminococcus sp.]